MLRAGVVPTPVIARVDDVRPGDILVLATDGIWDVLSDEDVAAIVMMDHQHHQCLTTTTSNENEEEILSTNQLFLVDRACELIVQEARQRWIGDLPLADESPIDDITCMVVKLGA